MKITQIVLLIAYFLLYNVSSANATNLNLISNPTPSNITKGYRPYNIQNILDSTNNQIKINPQLQQHLQKEIGKAQQELTRLSKTLSIEFTQNIGLVYIHQGYENWSIQFTYGGILLTTPKPIIVSTPEVFHLRQLFNKAKNIEIAGTKYSTTGYMRQLGAILHKP